MVPLEEMVVLVVAEMVVLVLIQVEHLAQQTLEVVEVVLVMVQEEHPALAVLE